MRPIQLVTALLLQRNIGHIVDRLVTFDAQTAVWLDDSWHWLRRKRRSVERLARQLPWLRWLLLPFAALLLTGLFGTGYQTDRSGEALRTGAITIGATVVGGQVVRLTSVSVATNASCRQAIRQSVHRMLLDGQLCALYSFVIAGQ